MVQCAGGLQSGGGMSQQCAPTSGAETKASTHALPNGRGETSVDKAMGVQWGQSRDGRLDTV